MRELTQSGIAAMEKRITEVVKDVDCWFLTCREHGMSSLDQAIMQCEDEDRNGFEISALYTKSGHPECITPEDNWFTEGIIMLEASWKHLEWIINQEDSQGSRTMSEHRKCVLAAIIEERVNKMFRQIDNDEREGFLPSGSLDQARRELGYIVD
jgi:hypothetical protein